MRVGRSSSASGTRSASVTTCVISASTLANRGDNEGRMNVAALAIPLTGLFTCANLCAAATACRPCFVPPYEHERAALVRGRFWPVPHCVYAWLWLPTRSHGPPSARAVGFANIFAFDEDVEHSHVSAVVVQVKFTAPQS